MEYKNRFLYSLFLHFYSSRPWFGFLLNHFEKDHVSTKWLCLCHFWSEKHFWGSLVITWITWNLIESEIQFPSLRYNGLNPGYPLYLAFRLNKHTMFQKYATCCQFHQHFTHNFYARGAQKHKMTMLTWLSFFCIWDLHA